LPILNQLGKQIAEMNKTAMPKNVGTTCSIIYMMAHWIQIITELKIPSAPTPKGARITFLPEAIQVPSTPL